ncbi:MAG: MBL fold metallo-hydrolase [Candidatus Moranbacteria bacterium]|nr:MBL fold metallo-hydrolase [Candidatus Moranbacteria bacterium]
MTTIKVLIEGYAKELENGWIASSTTCLITTDDKKIITDPGCNRQQLLEALHGENLTTDDIDYVFLSHCHPDHILLAGIFEKAKYVTFDSNLIYDKDLLTVFDKNALGKDIEIIETPGHVLEHLSLLVDTPQGKVAIAGDVIWWVDGEAQVVDTNKEDHSHAKGMNMEDLIESRKKLLAVADYIIPGHGKMFKVNNGQNRENV